MRFKPILATALGLVALAAASGLLTAWIFRALERRAQASDPALHPLLPAQEQPPPPWLQASPAQDLRAFRERERQLLSEYAWIDREGGLVRIPLERALELVLSEGLDPQTGDER